MIAAMEVGTSRTRIRLVEGEDNIFGESIEDVGMRNVAINRNNSVMKEAMKNGIQRLVESKGIPIDRIEAAVSHGLVTSDLGLVRIEHVQTPAGIEKIAAHTVTKSMPEILPVPITFIPGVKNAVDEITIDNLDAADFMRGEETQIMGLLRMKEIMKRVSAPFCFLMVSSFSKLIIVNTKEEIEFALTNVTGEMFPAIMKETFLSGMLPKDFKAVDTVDRKMVLKGVEYVEQVGFTRALMLIRLMTYFMPVSEEDALSFLEGILAGIDLSYFLPELHKRNFDGDLILAGDSVRRGVYELLLKEFYHSKMRVLSLDDESITQATVQGAVSILNRSRNS